ncbi:MAG: DUF2089 domain-containing protein [Planctomycetota bacterium]|jgi:hypothetical protein
MTKKAKQVDLPVSCPLCGESIEVTRVRCGACASEINGSFQVSEFTLLPVEYQKFITVFLRHRGNIKAVEKELGISYPTINKMLEAINKMLETSAEQKPLDRKEILDAIDRGEMSVRDATYILKTRK